MTDIIQYGLILALGVGLIGNSICLAQNSKQLIKVGELLMEVGDELEKWERRKTI